MATGVSFLRGIEIDVEVDGEIVDTPIRLGAEPLHDGNPAALVTEADVLRAFTLAPGEPTRAVLAAGAERVVLRARALRPDVEAAPGLDLSLPTYDVVPIELR